MGFLNYISLNSEFVLYFKVNFKSIFYPDNTVDKRGFLCINSFTSGVYTWSDTWKYIIRLQWDILRNI